MQETFISKIEQKDCTAYHDDLLLPPENGYLDDSDFEDIEISWSLEMQARSYGLTGHIKSITGIFGRLVTRYFVSTAIEEDDSCSVTGELSFFINDKFEEFVKYKSDIIEIDLSLEVDFNFEENGNLYPSELEVNFRTKTITVK